MNNEKDKGGNKHETVVIHIGKEKLVSPNPTTGKALYELGNVDCATMDLFRELPGKGDDELIPCSEAVIQLKDGDHFYTAQKILNPGHGSHRIA
jgi:hypothetical protein